MVYAWLVLHAREPQFFKTGAVPSRPPPMGLCENVLGVVGSGGWSSQSSFPAFAQAQAGDIRTSMPGTRALDSSSSSPRFPLLLCSVVILHSLYYSSSLTLSQTLYILTHRPPTQQNHHLSAPAAPTLPHSDVPSTATCRDTPSYSARIQVLPRVCRFRASHRAPDEKTARLISRCPWSVINIKITAIHPERQRIRHPHLGRQATARRSSDDRYQRERRTLNTATATTGRHRPHSHSLPRSRLGPCSGRSRRNRFGLSTRLHLPHLAALDSLQR
jgi:hypothetical protein